MDNDILQSPKVQTVLKHPHLIRAELCRRDFYTFVKEFWSTIIEEEPIYNWHMKYLCDELQKQAYRVMAGLPKLYDLIINIPPGTSKSTIVTQMFPAWCWIATLPKGQYPKEHAKLYRRLMARNKRKKVKKHIVTGDFLRFISASYSSPLSLEHADYCRDIVISDKYKMYFPEIVIRRDKNMKSNYKLDSGGTRFSTSVGGTVTGTHAHFILLDDPMNPKESMSEADRLSANQWVDHTLSTRKVSKAVSMTICIMQRLHEDDTTGHLLNKVKEGKRIRHICLPGELSDKVKPPGLKKYYKEGLLDPVRMSKQVLADMLPELGQYGYAGQVEQDPAPPEGGMFKVNMIRVVNAPPSKITKIVRYWDKAGTDALENKKAAYTAGVRMARMENGCYLIYDVKRGQWGSHEREQTIKQTAQIDGKGTAVYTEQEPGSGGKESAQSTIRNLAGFRVFADRPTGNKITRADTFSVQVNAGNVYIMRGEWNYEYLEELRHFPMGKFKDQVDASSGAFAQLVTYKRAGAYGSRKKR